MRFECKQQELTWKKLTGKKYNPSGKTHGVPVKLRVLLEEEGGRTTEAGKSHSLPLSVRISQ